jgi:hypothetical protein
MKRLQSCETQEYSLEVMECDCGFHIGFDATFMDQIGDFAFDCPSCGKCIETTKIFPEVEDENEVFNHILEKRKQKSKHRIITDKEK